MQCPVCNTQNTKGAKFCCKCGAQLSEPSENPSETKTAQPTLLSDTAEVKPEWRSPRRTKAVLATSILAVAAVLAIIVFFANSAGTNTLGQNAQSFEEAFAVSSLAEKGVANNQFLYESAYSVTSFDCKSIDKITDDEVVADINATLENANFKSDLHVRGRYIDLKSTRYDAESLSRYKDGFSFEVVDQTTTPKKGIDYDSKLPFADVNAELSTDGKTCTVAHRESLWFVDIDANYSYNFTGKGWERGGDPKVSCVYKKEDIEGTYKSRKGNDFTMTIRDLDESKGTFTADYAVAGSEFFGKFKGSGTFEATITAPVDVFGKSTLLNRFSIDGKGTSSVDHGKTEASGKFTEDEGKIKFGTFKLDATRTSSGKDSISTETFGITVYKQ